MSTSLSNRFSPLDNLKMIREEVITTNNKVNSTTTTTTMKRVNRQQTAFNKIPR
jgi:hypothetical protein